MVTLLLGIIALAVGFFFGAGAWHLYLKKLLDKNAQAFGDMFDVNIREVRRVRRKFGGFGVTVVEYEMEDRNNEG